jgi:hypothetical protein
LFLFAKEYKEGSPNCRPDIVVIEDKVAAHKLDYSNKLYISWKVVRFLWPANSPNLNIIKPYWFYIKIEIIKKGAIYLNKELRAA